jgi:hypothetical protein
MRFAILLLAVGTVRLSTAAPAEDPDVLRARLNIQRLKALVDAGAVPRSYLEQAEDSLADAQDLAVLRQNISAQDLTEEKAGEMVAAAERRLARRQKQLDRMRGLVEQGIAAKNELQTYSDQLNFARQEYDLAVSRATLCREMAELARAEQVQRAHQPVPGDGTQPAVRYDGNGAFTTADFAQLSAAFEHHFAKPLPVSALGETAVHRALGFDHRGRVDVALSPDQPEGIWLRQYLEARRIPYFAFWHAVPGKATGAHIHIGPESTRLAVSVRRRGPVAD